MEYTSLPKCQKCFFSQSGTLINLNENIFSNCIITHNNGTISQHKIKFIGHRGSRGLIQRIIGF